MKHWHDGLSRVSLTGHFSAVYAECSSVISLGWPGCTLTAEDTNHLEQSYLESVSERTQMSTLPPNFELGHDGRELPLPDAVLADADEGPLPPLHVQVIRTILTMTQCTPAATAGTEKEECCHCHNMLKWCCGCRNRVCSRLRALSSDINRPDFSRTASWRTLLHVPAA
eukprot:GHVU01013763.1.p1 GENE.GHVU01013763.1~~GHVU01013763.1.p1  ORF type:complete len:169 (+),score=1.38 GHVU01013763.1:378-884(+)